ncbi:MAG TPA: hypothetical protein VGF18_04215 [Candidatus Tumulicola sp.]|jgi:hypothetical protein
MTRRQFDVQTERLTQAVKALRDSRCYLQAIARAYYVVYCTATYVGAELGLRVAHHHQGKSLYQGTFTHNEAVDLVMALYEGQNSGNIEAGNATGVTGARLSPSDAAKQTNALQKARKLADYGPTNVVEPFSAAQADEYLTWSDDISHDLRTLLP